MNSLLLISTSLFKDSSIDSTFSWHNHQTIPISRFFNSLIYFSSSERISVARGVIFSDEEIALLNVLSCERTRF